MKEKVDVADLQIGMFVEELDRPWLETPFLLQGFLLRTPEHIEAVRQHCQFVYIDRLRSVGDAHRPASREAIRPQLRPRTAPLAKPPARRANQRLGGFRGALTSILRTAVRGKGGRAASEKSRSEAPRPSTLQVQGTDEDWGKLRQQTSSITAVELGFLAPASQVGRGESAAGYAGAPRRRRKGLFARLWTLFGARIRERGGADAFEADGPPPVYPETATFEGELPQATAAHEQSVHMAEQLYADIRANNVIEVRKVQEGVETLLGSVLRNANSVMWLARLKARDPRDYDHGLNVAILLLCFGRHLGLPASVLEILGTAGLMQDVGKLKLPAELIERRSVLSDPELELIQTHVEHSLQILKESNNTSPLLLEIVAQHHERFDGSGYPKGLKGDKISMLGAMAGIVDTYEAMVGGRPYRAAVTPQYVLREMYQLRGSAFHAELVEKFIQCIGVFPVGSLVELNTNEVAIVMAHSQERRLKPRLMLLLDPGRQPYTTPVVLDLLTEPLTPSGEPYHIVRGLQAGAQSSELYERASAAEAQRLGLVLP